MRLQCWVEHLAHIQVWVGGLWGPRPHWIGLVILRSASLDCRLIRSISFLDTFAWVLAPHQAQIVTHGWTKLKTEIIETANMSCNRSLQTLLAFAKLLLSYINIATTLDSLLLQSLPFCHHILLEQYDFSRKKKYVFQQTLSKIN